MQHDVSYPNGAKKKDLVDLFNQHIKPQAGQRLKELQAVIANDDGIVYVDKKSKKSKSAKEDDTETLKVEKKRSKSSKKAADPEEPEIRKSPRKTSKSTKSQIIEGEEEQEEKESQLSPRKSRASARNTSGELGKIPDLKKSPPRVRERSPRRKASLKTKTEESESVETTKPRERSPRRKVSDKTETKTRERSPAKKTKESVKEEVIETKPKKKETKKKPKVKEEPKAEEEDNNSSHGDLEQLTNLEFEQASPYKFGAKFESSFSKDNVFQSPGHSSPDVNFKKTIPRKRTSENSSKSPRKSTKTIRKTAFSSSPEPSQAVKSPTKKALEISKFETSSPPSNFLKNEINSNDIFATDEFTGQPFDFDNVTEKIPSSISKTTFHDNEHENFETPNDGNVSRITHLSSNASTPSKSESKTRKSFMPDLSKFKVSREFAKSLGITVQGELEEEKEKHEEPVPESEDPELINIASDGDDDEDDDEVNGETERSVNDDSVLRNLQEEIDSANSAVQKEAADAIKQVNDVFNEDKGEMNTSEKIEKQKSKSIVNFLAIFDFFKQIFLFLFFVFIVIFGLWYREQRILIGYCGSEIDQPTFPNAQNEYLIKFDDFLQTLKPQCLEAPEHAIILPRLKIKCRPDYAVYEPWYKFHGVFPFSDYCVKDEEKENIIKEVVSKSLELLRTKNANTKCGDGDDFEVGISDEELYEFFFESKAVSL